VVFPALFTEPMATDIGVEFLPLRTADVTASLKLLQLIGIPEPLLIPNFLPEPINILEVVTEFLHIPLELPEQQQTPPLPQGCHFLGSFQVFFHLGKESIVGQDLILFGLRGVGVEVVVVLHEVVGVVVLLLVVVGVVLVLLGLVVVGLWVGLLLGVHV